MKTFTILTFVLIVMGFLSFPVQGQRYGTSGLHPAVASRPNVGRGLSQHRRPSVLPLPRANKPLYNPYFSIYFGPIYEEYDEPCYYDEYYGQWVGPCDVSLDTPGFSITVPNQIRR